MKDFLKEQLERTNYWLSFAEAKNAALVALNIAVIAVCTQIDFLDVTMQVLLCVLFIASTFCCLKSFSPKINNKATGDDTIATENYNLIFYADVVKIGNADKYLDKLQENYEFEFHEKEKNECRDLAEEIIINSEITMSKYRLFKKAIKIDMITILVFIVCLIIA